MDYSEIFPAIIGTVLAVILSFRYVIPFVRMRELENELRRYQKKSTFLKSQQGILERIQEVTPKDNKGHVETLAIITANSKEKYEPQIKHLITRLSYFQDDLIELDRRSSLEPRIWWTQKYCTKLDFLKKETRKLLQELDHLF